MFTRDHTGKSTGCLSVCSMSERTRASFSCFLCLGWNENALISEAVREQRLVSSLGQCQSQVALNSHTNTCGLRPAGRRGGNRERIGPPIHHPSMMRLLICHVARRSCRPGVGASYGLNLKLSQEAFPRELRQSIVPRQLELRAPPRSKLKLLL